MRKSLSAGNVESLADQLQQFVGARLQDTWVKGQMVAFRFFLKHNVWLHLDLNPANPQLFATHERPMIKKGPPKPVALFLNAHFDGARLSAVTYDPGLARVLVFHFEGRGEIEVRLFPHGQNLIVRTLDGKRLSWEKIQDLKAQAFSQPAEAAESISLFRESKSEDAAAVGRGAGASDELLRQKRIKKILGAIEKVEADLKEKEQAPYQQIGEWLKENGTLEVPDQWRQFIQSKSSLSENIETMFSKAKATRLKIQGSKDRLSALQKELSDVEAGIFKVEARPQFKDKDIRARTFELAKDLHFFVGKSGQDNLKVLREAKPWHLWLHLRDYPGAHGILAFSKGRAISDDDLHRAANELLKVQFGAKVAGRHGERFDLLVAECRHVSPIRGDSHGRVTHKNTRTLRHEFRA